MDLYSFFFFFLIWEACSLVIRFFLPYVVAHSAFRRFCPDEKRRADISVYGVAYLTSTIHSIIVSIRGSRHLWRLWNAPGLVKLQVPDSTAYDLKTMTLYADEAHSVIFTNIILGGYLVSDLIHVILNYPKLGRLDTVSHHLVFLLCSWLAGSYCIFPFMFGWLIIGEASTPFLNFRWLLIQSNNGDGKLMAIVSASFAAVFFLTRCFGYTFGLAHQLMLYYRHGPLEGVPTWVTNVIMALIVGGFALNIAWFGKIWKIAMRGGKKPQHDAGPTIEKASSTLVSASAAASASNLYEKKEI